MPITVQAVEYLEAYRVRLTFSTGETGVADLAELVRTVPGAAPLRELTEFQRLFLDEWPTLAWPCGFDLAPEYAYELATGQRPSWQEEPLARRA